MGTHTLRRIIKDACSSLQISGNGDNAGIVTHSIRGTVATLLIERRADFSTTMRTGHKHVESLRSYQNLRGLEGRIQQRLITSNPESPVCNMHDSKISPHDDFAPSVVRRKVNEKNGEERCPAR